MYPTFKITKFTKNPDGLELEGFLSSDSFKTEKWIDDGWLGFLRSENQIIYGRWKKHNNKWKFLINLEDLPATSNLQPEKELVVFDGYWGERVELVLDKNIIWNELIYTTKDDHEHCAICWKTVSEFDNQNYMLGDNRIAVCLECFQRFVEQSKLDFIVTR